MTKQILTSILLMAFVSATAAATISGGENEPQHRGKKLSEWLLIYQRAESGDSVSTDAANAVRAIGTNAVPFLVKWIGRETPSPRVKPDPGMRSDIAEQVQQYNVALKGFQILGPEARAAIPDLVLIMRGTNEFMGTLAFGALSAMRQDSVPPLLDLLTNQQSYAVRQDTRIFWAVRGFMTIRQDGHDAVSDLLRIKGNSKDPAIRNAAAEALRYVAPEIRSHGMRIKARSG